EQGSYFLDRLLLPLLKWTEMPEDVIQMALQDVLHVMPELGVKVVFRLDRAGDRIVDQEVVHHAIDFLLSCLEDTPLNRIIDPDRLGYYLRELLVQMWNQKAFVLEELFAILMDAPGVETTMVHEYFVWLQHKNMSKHITLVFPQAILQLSLVQVQEYIQRVKEYDAEAKTVMDSIPSAGKIPQMVAAFSGQSVSRVGLPARDVEQVEEKQSNYGNLEAQRKQANAVRTKHRTDAVLRALRKADPHQGLNLMFRVFGLVAALLALLLFFTALWRTKPSLGGKETGLLSFFASDFSDFSEIRVQDDVYHVRVKPRFSEKVSWEQRAEMVRFWSNLRKKRRNVEGLAVFSSDQVLLFQIDKVESL
ncbi:MAG: hypothetical protein AAGJ35_02860, partial [Myxococcota bacterium]